MYPYTVSIVLYRIYLDCRMYRTYQTGMVVLYTHIHFGEQSNLIVLKVIIDSIYPKEVGSIHMSFILDCIFDSVFHVSLNSHYTKLETTAQC